MAFSISVHILSLGSIPAHCALSLSRALSRSVVVPETAHQDPCPSLLQPVYEPVPVLAKKRMVFVLLSVQVRAWTRFVPFWTLYSAVTKHVSCAWHTLYLAPPQEVALVGRGELDAHCPKGLGCWSCLARRSKEAAEARAAASSTQFAQLLGAAGLRPQRPGGRR